MRLLIRIVCAALVVLGKLAAQVEVSLVTAESAVQSSHPLTVAIRLQHEPHWHTYWQNPGTGLPTTVSWELPTGWSAEEISWPVPRSFEDATGTVTGHGYEGDVLLPVVLTPPAGLVAGDTVKLRARVDWLMCRESCVPGSGYVEAVLPVTPGAVARNLDWSERIAGIARPVTPTGWVLDGTREGGLARLTIRCPGSKLDFGPQLHFFPLDSVVAYDASQLLARSADGIDLALSLGPDGIANEARLRGVLATVDARQGWVIDCPLRHMAASPAVVAPAAGAGSLAGTLLLAWFGGLVLNLMPCVFPVLGIKILGFVNQSGNDRKKITLHGLVFTIGVLLSFWSLAGALLILRAGGSQLGWGFQLQSPGFVFGLAVFMLVFALNMSGIFEVGLAATGAGATLQMKQGFAGSFFTGALATLVATPCSAPFLAPALGAALALSAFQSFLVFTAIGVGLSTPYLLLSIFPQAIKILPRPGAWMETFKQLMAFPLYATVGWLLWVFAGQTKENDDALLLISFAFVLVAMATWLYGRFGQAYGKKSRQYFGRVTAAVCFLAALYVGWPTDRSDPVTPGQYQVTWEKWSPEAVKAARAAGRYVYVDFTARWCATCQTNKATVFHSAEVLAALAQKKVVLLRADWTNRDPLITAELRRWQRSAVPFNLVYAPERAEPVILPELLSAGAVLTAVQ